ncbi:MAG: hypothetical protein QME14_09700 [Methanobacteriaceae archaeon]|nr:hypothetical protein [Methanobacteriaceae archaeon]
MYPSSILKTICIIYLVFIFSAPSIYAQNIEVYWNSTASANINLGTVLADGSTYYWSGGSTGLQVRRVTPRPNEPANLYVRASGDFSDGYGNIISLGNFRYSNYGGSVSSQRSFETTNRLVRANWTRSQMEYLPVDLYLTVPSGTEPGNYTVTIIHVIVASDALQPVDGVVDDVTNDIYYNLTEDTNNSNSTNNSGNLTKNLITAPYILVRMFDYNLLD